MMVETPGGPEPEEEPWQETAVRILTLAFWVLAASALALLWGG